MINNNNAGSSGGSGGGTALPIMPKLKAVPIHNSLNQKPNGKKVFEIN